MMANLWEWSEFMTLLRQGLIDLENIKIILMDVDGVLTDGRIILGENEELKCFDAKDGMGISLARKNGLKIGFITGRTSKAVERRGKELAIDFLYQGCRDKVSAANEILKKEGLEYQNICYIGDDINDIQLLRKVGFSATVNNVPEYLKKEVDYVSQESGGRGAVRDIIEHILKSKGILTSSIEGMVNA